MLRAPRGKTRTLAGMKSAAKGHIVTLVIAAIIGVPATLISLQLARVGAAGVLVLLIPVPGLLAAPIFGMVGLVVVQVAYYFLIAMGLKALIRRFFLARVKRDAN